MIDQTKTGDAQRAAPEGAVGRALLLSLAEEAEIGLGQDRA